VTLVIRKVVKSTSFRLPETMLDLILYVLLISGCQAFSVGLIGSKNSLSISLYAKRKDSSGSGKGFGSPEVSKSNPSFSLDQTTGGLQSIESVGRDTEDGSMRNPPSSFVVDPSLPVEARTKKILAEQYGLRTLEQQRQEEKLVEQRLKFERLKQEAEKNDADFDLMAVLPGPLILAIDRFLKVGLAISVLLFLAAGVGITVEAYSVASGNPLPDEINNFIVKTIEPNFTPGLLVLLGFSVSLGLFASAQLGSSRSIYTEDR
jgi:hypothetical protein